MTSLTQSALGSPGSVFHYLHGKGFNHQVVFPVTSPFSFFFFEGDDANETGFLVSLTPLADLRLHTC